MANNALASGSSCACPAFSYECPKPQVRGSRKTNFFAFGLGVSSISEIFGMAVVSSSIAQRRVHRVSLGLGGGAGFGVESGLQCVPRQDGALHAHWQLADARENRQPTNVRAVFR